MLRISSQSEFVCSKYWSIKIKKDKFISIQANSLRINPKKLASYPPKQTRFVSTQANTLRIHPSKPACIHSSKPACTLKIQTCIDHISQYTSPNATKFKKELAYNPKNVMIYPNLKNVHDLSHPKNTISCSIRIGYVSATNQVEMSADRSRGPIHVRGVFRDWSEIFATQLINSSMRPSEKGSFSLFYAVTLLDSIVIWILSIILL